MSLFSSPRPIAHGPHLSSLHKPHLRCGVASAWQPQHLATRSTRAGFAISSTFPVVDNGTNSMISGTCIISKMRKNVTCIFRLGPDGLDRPMDMGKYHMNYKVFERVLQDFLHQESTVAEKRSDKHTGKVPVKHTFTIKHSKSLLRTCLSWDSSHESPLARKRRSGHSRKDGQTCHIHLDWGGKVVASSHPALPRKWHYFPDAFWRSPRRPFHHVKPCRITRWNSGASGSIKILQTGTKWP